MVIKDGAKMSKSKGNVVDPDVLIKKYGADTVRLFSLFAAPPERDLEWSDQGVEGAYRFLNRVYRFVQENGEMLQKAKGVVPAGLNGAGRELHRKTHQTICKVSSDIDGKFHFNTAISAVMELTNTLYNLTGENVAEKPQSEALKEAVEAILLLLSPMVPHFCEELWQRLGHQTDLSRTRWPAFDADAAREEEITLVVQINGKVRSRLQVAADQEDEKVKEAALADEKVRKSIDGKTIRKVIVVKNKLINIVVS
jgi:leucyl-tRNA synthetase